MRLNMKKRHWLVLFCGTFLNFFIYSCTIIFVRDNRASVTIRESVETRKDKESHVVEANSKQTVDYRHNQYEKAVEIAPRIEVLP